jgi:hypothetical protein
MKPAKEKAEELCYKICLELPPKNGYLYAKQCALIAVDEIIQAIRFTDAKSDLGNVGYWQEVKSEIEKL